MGRHSTGTRRRSVWRKITSMLGIVSMAGAMAVAGSVAFAADPVTQQKVCAPSGDATAPYSPETLDVTQIVGHDADHGGYIIPSFDYTDGNNAVQTYPGLNWDAANQTIFNNDCALPPPPPTAAGVTVTKTLVGQGPFNPGQEFQYSISYSCSSLEKYCANAVITDTIPGELNFITNTTTGDPADITYDAGTRQLKVVFKTIVASVNGQDVYGLKDGRNGQFLVTVKFPAGTPDGTTANNCAVITADNMAPGQSCAEAKALTTPDYGVSLDKRYESPFTGDTAISGVMGTGAATTLDLKATVGGNQAAGTVTVVDPDPAQTTNNNPFNSFDLTGIKTLSLPAGIQAEIQVKSTGSYSTVGTYTSGQTPALPGASGIAAGDVTGIQVTYSCVDPAPGGSVCVNGRIPAGQALDIKAGVQLRDTLRSGGAVTAGTIHNQAKATATYPGAGPKTDTDTADYTVAAQTATVTASKTIDPAQAQEKSGADVTMTVGGRNTGNIAGTSMTVTDPDPSSTATPFDHFTFKSFNALANLPAGVTAEVKVLVGATWTSIGSGLGNGSTPSLGGISAADVKGVQYIYTGTIAKNTEIKNSFVATLKDSVPAGTLNPANCDAVSMTTSAGGSAGQDQACAPFTVTAISTSITAGKSFNPTSGVAHTGAKTTVSLSGTNGSNVPITSFQLVDPGTGSDATFGYFDFTGFGALTAPSGTTWKVEVHNGTTWLNVGTYTAGTTPPNGDLPIAAGSVQGVRYTLTNGGSHPIPAGATALSTTIGLQLRDTVRNSATAIDSGTVHNCTTATSTGIAEATRCADYTINAVNPGTGTGVAKNIAKETIVQDTGDTTNVALTGKNGANVSVDTLILEDSPATAAAFWNSFAFNGFGSVSRPTGTTSLTVEYYTGTAWASVGTYAGTGNVTPTLPGGVTDADVHGVRYTWTGTIAASATVTANFSAKVKDGAATGAVQDCVEQTYSGGLVTSPVKRSACDSITITAKTHTVDRSKSFSPATGTIGLNPTTTATLSVKNNSNVPLDSIVVTDPDGVTTPFDKFDLTGFGSVTLPNNVQVLIEVNSGSWQTVGTYTGGQTVTVPAGISLGDVTGVRLTFSGTGANKIPASSSAMSVGVKLQLRDTVRGSTTAVDTTAIQNCFATTTDPVATLTGDPCATYTPQAQSPGVSAAKTWSPETGIRDELPASTITIKGRNSGNVPVDALVLQDPAFTGAAPAVADTAFDYFDVTGLTGLVLPEGANQVKIDVLTADGTWHDGTAAATLPTGATVNGVALGDIVGVRATFSNSDSAKKLPVVTDAGKTGNVGISVKLRATLRSSGAQIVVPPAGSTNVDNQSSALVIYLGNPGNPQTADARYTITSGSAKVTPDKTLYPSTSPTTVNPNQTVLFQLALANTGTRNIVAPIVTDKFDPAQLKYDDALVYPEGQFQFVQGTGPALDPSLITVGYDATNAPGAVSFAFPDSYVLAPGQTAYIRIALTTQPGLAANTEITNTYGVTWDVTVNGAVSCQSGTSTTFDGQATWCTDSQKIKVQKANSMASVKWIKGEDSLGFTNVDDTTPGATCPTDAVNHPGFTRFPCIAHTEVDKKFSYDLDLTVSGNVSIGQVRAIDVLPHVGDTGVILSSQPRNTEWTPTFVPGVTVTGLPAGATYTLYYADTYTPCTTPLTNSGGAWCGDWSTTDHGADTKAIAIEVFTAAGAPLAPGATFTLHWQMQAPSTAPGTGVIAWNSFGFTGLPTDGTPWLPAAEPRKVGIDLSSPSVTVEKSAQGGDGTFQFTLQPVSQGTPGTALPGGSVTTSNGTGSFTWGPGGGQAVNLVPGGTYRLTELPASRWTSTFEQCVSTDAVTHVVTPVTPVDSGADFVEFVAPVNGEVTCSFTNTYNPPPPGTTPPTVPPTTSTPPTTTVPPTTSTTVEVSGSSSSISPSGGTSSTGNIEVLPSSEDIAYTGVNALGMGALALLLLTLGGGLLWLGAAGRRRDTQH